MGECFGVHSIYFNQFLFVVNEEFPIYTCQYWQNLLELEFELSQQRVLYLMQGSVNSVAGAEEGK